MEEAVEAAVEQTSDPRLWKKAGWTARVTVPSG